jgi:hypothetical protein
MRGGNLAGCCLRARAVVLAQRAGIGTAAPRPVVVIAVCDVVVMLLARLVICYWNTGTVATSYYYCAMPRVWAARGRRLSPSTVGSEEKVVVVAAEKHDPCAWLECCSTDPSKSVTIREISRWCVPPCRPGISRSSAPSVSWLSTYVINVGFAPLGGRPFLGLSSAMASIVSQARRFVFGNRVRVRGRRPPDDGLSYVPSIASTLVVLRLQRRASRHWQGNTVPSPTSDAFHERLRLLIVLPPIESEHEPPLLDRKALIDLRSFFETAAGDFRRGLFFRILPRCYPVATNPGYFVSNSNQTQNP